MRTVIQIGIVVAVVVYPGTGATSASEDDVSAAVVFGSCALPIQMMDMT